MKKIKSIEELKQIEFATLLYIKGVCEREKIPFFLSGGTLLGAIRHQGFIPWDDDVDVMLIRKHYNRLIKAINEDENSHYRVLTYKTDSEYYYPFAKVVDTRTKVIENVKVPFENAGVGVDLFPIDGLPVGYGRQKKFFHKMKKLRNLFDQYYIIGDGNGNRKIQIFVKRKILRLITRIIDCYASFYPFEKSDYAAVSVWGYGEKECVRKSCFQKRIKVEFEKVKLYAPVGYDTYLKNLYGDYIKLPPKSKQHSDHNISAWYKT